ncbi:Acetyltransferase (GNAT) domain-containing protein [Amycolatopsis marina]|uniref:Acetyltransferase (GNAT) domain-containing protein n=1 Tax=Amycolatopsis marina TaxID=490629 RepID=A0A1I1BWV2_9PSEU|nr:GNAT family N-acetyltransferase [Amycolatopsis marina]SFB54761.1 Acetyltransferase (GNAT) domain-containing protein [Amycolatopsis marina]
MTNHRIRIRRPERAELPAVAEAYTAANLHDPVLSWVIDDEDARRRLAVDTGPEVTMPYLESILLSGALVIAEEKTGVVAGISIWERIDYSQGTGTSTLQDPEGAQFIEHTYGEFADRMKLLIELTGQRRPQAGTYWYLSNVVVDPDRRGQGIGGAMLREQLGQLDAERVPAYLEASSPRNRRLYERVGFTDVGDPIELPDGPRLQPMWRPASAEVARSPWTG